MNVMMIIFIENYCFFTAYDAKERQHWVNRLRATAEHHTDYLAQVVFVFFKCFHEAMNVNDRDFDQNL